MKKLTPITIIFTVSAIAFSQSSSFGHGFGLPKDGQLGDFSGKKFSVIPGNDSKLIAGYMELERKGAHFTIDIRENESADILFDNFRKNLSHPNMESPDGRFSTKLGRLSGVPLGDVSRIHLLDGVVNPGYVQVLRGKYLITCTVRRYESHRENGRKVTTDFPVTAADTKLLERLVLATIRSLNAVGPNPRAKELSSGMG